MAVRDGARSRRPPEGAAGRRRACPGARGTQLVDLPVLVVRGRRWQASARGRGSPGRGGSAHRTPGTRPRPWSRRSGRRWRDARARGRGGWPTSSAPRSGGRARGLPERRRRTAALPRRRRHPRLPESLRADLPTAGLTHLTAVSGANLSIIAESALWVAGALRAPRRLRVVLLLLTLAGLRGAGAPVAERPAGRRAWAAVGVTAAALSRRPRAVPRSPPRWSCCWSSTRGSPAAPASRSPSSPPAGCCCSRRSGRDGLCRWLPRPLALAVAAPAAAQVACGPVLVLLQPSLSLVAVPANLARGARRWRRRRCSASSRRSPARVSPPLAHRRGRRRALGTGWIAAGRAPGGAAAARVRAVARGARAAPFCSPCSRPASWSRRARVAGGPAGHAAGRHSCAGDGARAPRPAADRGVLAIVAGPSRWVGGLARPESAPVPRHGAPGTGPSSCATSGRATRPCCAAGRPGGARRRRSRPAARRRGCLRRLGVRHLDLVVLTHFHADHVGGLAGALAGRDRRARPRQPARGSRPRTPPRSARLAAAAGVPLRRRDLGDVPVGRRATAGAVAWRVLSPSGPPVAADGDGDRRERRRQRVERGRRRDRPGPAGPAAGRPPGRPRDAGPARARRPARRRRDAPRRPGRRRQGRPPRVRQAARGVCTAAIEARVALIGVGAGNDYGHPAPSALALLRRAGH